MTGRLRSAASRFQLDPNMGRPFTLARELGMTVERLLDEMTATEYLDWQAFLLAEAMDRRHERRRQRG